MGKSYIKNFNFVGAINSQSVAKHLMPYTVACCDTRDTYKYFINETIWSIHTYMQWTYLWLNHSSWDKEMGSLFFFFVVRCSSNSLLPSNSSWWMASVRLHLINIFKIKNVLPLFNVVLSVYFSKRNSNLRANSKIQILQLIAKC